MSTHPRIIAEPVKFINLMLAEGRYFYKEIDKDGILLYDTCCYDLSKEEPQPIEDQKRIAQEYFDEAFPTAKDFYFAYELMLKNCKYKIAAFDLHQATEHAYKAVLLVCYEAIFQAQNKSFLNFSGFLTSL